MTTDQRNTIQAILVDRGLTFTPLREEMIDHIGCDVELLMSSGRSFEEALQKTLDDIPAEHFSAVQRDVLVGIDKRFASSKWLSYLTIAAILLAFLFKVLHLQFSEELLIISFLLIAITLLRGSLFGTSLTGKTIEITRVLFTLAGLIILLAGYAFKILHLAGAEWIIVIAISITATALLGNTYAVFQHVPGRETMLTFLHEKYTPSIERFLLILLFVITAVKIISIAAGFQVPNAAIILLVVIFGAGLHFIVLTWGILEQQVLFKRAIFLCGIAIISICLTLPFLGEILKWEIRVVSVTVFTAISAWLAFRMQQHTETVVSSIMVVLVPLLFIIWATLKFHILPIEFHKYVFNLPILGVLGAGLLLSRKYDTMRSYMIISLAGYLMEYST